MEVIGWIREGDKAACGGTVVEGDQNCHSDGRAYAFEGARMACPKNCVIAEGYEFRTVTNGCNQVLHGMKTSGGCPLLSTINDFDGLFNESGEEVPIRFVLDDAGKWVGKTNDGYDHQFLLTDESTGNPLPNRYYRMTLNGKVTEGKSDAHGKTEKVTSDDPAEVTVEIMPEGYSKAGE
ncbi:PAAR domain-containing protein [Massilia horti]|uniref:PAAR domain-containing protein n=1 Tax=Massilia horti TaxID=2562153 RepID=A0A4Y9SS47_9BURK|nr:PAAR domain-containing protein [Massilia horti]TFW29612.1 PAAR domain-containing protein [Massilia horti]